MRLINVFLLLFFIFLNHGYAQVGIGTDSPHSSAMLDLNSTEKGFLPPRISNRQRDAIENPATGLMIYNNSTNCINLFSGNYWEEICGIIFPIVGSFDASSIVHTGSLQASLLANGVSSSINYSGASGGSYESQTVNSTGVEGLTATLSSGTLVLGFQGTLIITVIGTPSSSGNATFEFIIGGKSFLIVRTVAE